MSMNAMECKRGIHGVTHRLSHDQVSFGPGPSGLCRRPEVAPELFIEVLSPRFHATSVVRTVDASDFLGRRSSRPDRLPRGLERSAPRPATEETSPFFDSQLRRKTPFKKTAFRVLQREIFRRARKLKLISKRPEGIVDATGLETRHASRYYVWRKGQKRHVRVRWPKLTLVCDRRSHLLPGAYVSMGPSQDSPQFTPAMKEAAALVSFDRVLADAGYDAEHNHVLCRKSLGIRSTVIPARKRNTRKWPKAKYRRQMKKRFHKRVYGQRWQVESAISRNKRLLGSALRNRTWFHQKLECLCRVLTHNLMILRFVA
jgi:hypothetical protein